MELAFTAFHLALMAIAAAIFAAAAVNDAMTFRIPNYMSGLLLLIFPVFVWTSPLPIEWKQHAMLFVLVGVLGFILFLARLVGAGDIKLLSAASLWAGPHMVAVLLAVTAVSGGVLSIVMAARAFQRKMTGSPDAPATHKIPIPYGIAIATGGIAVLMLMAQPILMPS